MENDRNFLGIWIPAEVWLDHSISIIERALFAEIYSLDGPRGCFASNEYFAENFGVTVATISKGVARLKETGYIEQVSFDGRRRILRSLMRFERQTSKNLKADINGLEGRVKDFGRQGSNPLKHIEKKITKTDSKDYEGDAPAHVPDGRVKVSKGQPVTLVAEDESAKEITGPDATKSRKAKIGNEPGLSRHRYLTPAERWPAENMGLDGGWEAKKPAQVFADWFEATHRAKYPTITRPGMELLFGKMQEYAINSGNVRIKKAGGYVWEDAITNTWLDTPEKVRQYSIAGTGIPNVTQQAKMAREAGHTVTLREEWAAKYAEMKANEAAKGGPRP